MKHAASNEEVIRLFGLDGVTYYAQHFDAQLHAPTAEFLGLVGLPTDQIFAPRSEPENGFPTPRELGLLFERQNRICPPEQHRWAVLGSLVTAVIVLGPETGTVHAYPGGEDKSQLLHRDIESFVFTLCAFRRLVDAYIEDEGEAASYAYEFRQAVSEVDPTPLADEDTEWNRLLEEVLDGMW
ncbi:SUKH-4 family immunity protein [Streptomyces sp. NPDC059575]|uniref:SUKH-4 family immunity protein n=1 Tax=Streptomyces sp. NPDC059575 TaxID=3346872 RepID=UPI00368ABF20